MKKLVLAASFAVVFSHTPPVKRRYFSVEFRQDRSGLDCLC